MTGELDIIRAVESFADALRPGDTLACIDRHRADGDGGPYLIFESVAGYLSGADVDKDADLANAETVARVAFGAIRSTDQLMANIMRAA